MPEYVKLFAKQQPKIQIQVIVQQSECLEKRLLENQLDFAIIEGVIHEPGLIGEEYLEDILLPVTAAQGKFAPWQTLSQEEFRQQPRFFCGKKAAVPGRFLIKKQVLPGFPYSLCGRAPAIQL